MYAMAQWRQLYISDMRLEVFVAMTTGTIYMVNGIMAELVTSYLLRLTFS